MTPHRIRVLHVIQNLNYGGMERVLSDIALRCDQSRFETHVLCLQYLGRFAKGLEEVATLHVAGAMSRVSMIWPRALAAQIRAIAPDVIHSHSGVWHKASLAGRLAGVPRIIHTEHGRGKPDPIRSRLVDRLGASRTDVVVAVSAQLAAELVRSLKIPQKKVVSIPNGVDTHAYRPRADTLRLRSELGIVIGRPIVGSIGRLEWIKGYDVMIEAFEHLRGTGADRDAVLVIAGEGTQRRALENMIRERGLEGSVFLLGWRDDVLDMHSAFSLFTMSSRSEGTSISLLEAMSAGLPPVVTDVGGNAAVLGDTLRHCLVASEKPAALAGVWAAALADPTRLEQDRSAARKRVVDAFGLDAMVEAYQRVYTG